MALVYDNIRSPSEQLLTLKGKLMDWTYEDEHELDLQQSVADYHLF